MILGLYSLMRSGGSNMKTASIRKQPNWKNDSNGPDMFTVVDLYIDGDKYGEVDVTSHSYRYAEDVAENWENGVLREDNEYITKSAKSS